MFYILIILGSISIGLGKFMEKRYGPIKNGEQFIDGVGIEERKNNTPEKKNDTDLLEKRIDILEEMLFKKTLEQVSEEPVLSGQNKVEEDSLKKYELIKKYEREKKDLDQIAKLLKMNKGEVLLLKSLYKNL